MAHETIELIYGNRYSDSGAARFSYTTLLCRIRKSVACYCSDYFRVRTQTTIYGILHQFSIFVLRTIDEKRFVTSYNRISIFVLSMKNELTVGTRTYAFVRWNGAFSGCFEQLYGVRQGGVLSSVLFTLYVDDLIVRLRSARLGCSINNMFVGCVMYADDLVLLTCSICTLQAMISLCSEEIDHLDMKFNVA